MDKAPVRIAAAEQPCHHWSHGLQSLSRIVGNAGINPHEECQILEAAAGAPGAERDPGEPMPDPGRRRVRRNHDAIGQFAAGAQDEVSTAGDINGDVLPGGKVELSATTLHDFPFERYTFTRKQPADHLDGFSDRPGGFPSPYAERCGAGPAGAQSEHGTAAADLVHTG